MGNCNNSWLQRCPNRWWFGRSQCLKSTGKPWTIFLGGFKGGWLLYIYANYYHFFWFQIHLVSIRLGHVGHPLTFRWAVVWCAGGHPTCIGAVVPWGRVVGWCASFFQISIFLREVHTPPKFNIAPENWWLENYFPIGNVTFQGLC